MSVNVSMIGVVTVTVKVTKKGYDLFPICKVRKLKEGHTFKFETPCTSDKYTHSVSFPSNLS